MRKYATEKKAAGQHESGTGAGNRLCSNHFAGRGDAEAADDEDLLDNLLFSDQAESVINDEDISRFYDQEEDLAAQDDEFLATLAEEA